MKQITRTALAFMLCAAVAFVGGCSKDKGKSGESGGGSGPSGGAKAAIKNNTPQELLQSMHDTTKSKNLRNMSGLFVPEYAKPMEAIMGGMQDLGDAFSRLETATKEKIGKDQAEMIHNMNPMEMGMSSPLDKVVGKDGKIDWSKVKIKEKGDTATLTIEGKEADVMLHKVDGHWFVGPPAGENTSPQKMADEAKAQKERNDKMIKSLDAFTKKIQAGEVTKANFQAKFGEAMSGK